MRIIEYLENDSAKIGVLSEDCLFITPLQIPDEKTSPETTGETARVKTADVKLLTPKMPGKIVCVGRNYADHAAELGNSLPEAPLLFLKAPTSLIFDGDVIEIPPQSEQVEHEGELGLVIGKTCKNLKDDEPADEYILGYICLNDVTARDLQRRDVQFTRAKSFDTFCPVSRFIKTGVDTSDLRITTRVNGVIKQIGKTSQMVFPVEHLLRYISNQMTLRFGDIVATGTPAGVSTLKDGDICEVEIEGIGRISNPVRKV
jgi:2-keto-4-pentenoate hydratase/2-oxohepta-3-ene-1,7-dioic acid hydratase in catechol pathway